MTNNEILRVPPQSLDAEQAVLGGILIDADAIVRVIDIILLQDFYREGHRRIYGAMLELFKKNEPIDFITVSNQLRDSGKLEESGGVAYLSSLVDNIPTAANIHYYAGIVKEKSNLRRVISSCTNAIADAYDGGTKSHEIIQTVSTELIRIETGRDATVPISVPVKAELARIENKYTDKDYRPGWSTNYPSINDELGGIQTRNLFVVAARPSVGKTALLVNMVRSLSKQTPVLFFCIDQTNEEFARRLISRYGLINNYAIRDGKFRKEEWPKIAGAAADLCEMPVFITDNTHVTIDEIEFLTKKYIIEQKIGVVMIDYLQMIRRPGRRSENEEIGDITWRLKQMSKDLNINVMLLSQLNRNIEKRPDPRPVLSDLRGSGSIEQDANVVAFLHWDEKYVDPMTNKTTGILEFIVAKHKDGRIGKFRLRVDKPIYLMEEKDSQFS